MSSKPEVAAVINSNPDLVNMLRLALERVGFVVVIGHVQDLRSGALDLSDFVRLHEPRVIVYDLVMPYDSNWAFLSHLRDSETMRGRHFVLTAPNAAAMQKIVAPEEHIFRNCRRRGCRRRRSGRPRSGQGAADAVGASLGAPLLDRLAAHARDLRGLRGSSRRHRGDDSLPRLGDAPESFVEPGQKIGCLSRGELYVSHAGCTSNSGTPCRRSK